jgi:hypothetical protein
MLLLFYKTGGKTNGGLNFLVLSSFKWFVNNL